MQFPSKFIIYIIAKNPMSCCLFFFTRSFFIIHLILKCKLRKCKNLIIILLCQFINRSHCYSPSLLSIHKSEKGIVIVLFLVKILLFIFPNLLQTDHSVIINKRQYLVQKEYRRIQKRAIIAAIKL